jgi:sulfite reductase (NADPH) flavoprotein alpha-component
MKSGLGPKLLPLLAIAFCVLLPVTWQPALAQWTPPQAKHAAGVVTIIVLWFIGTWWQLRRRAVPYRSAPAQGSGDMLVVHASQTGVAADLARRTADALRAMAVGVRLVDVAVLDRSDLERAARALFVVSTTGAGDAPDAAFRFVDRTLRAPADLATLRYGVLALGDRDYRNFCAFGHRVDEWLRRSGATPWFDVIEVDNLDAGALRHWQHQLAVLAGHSALPDWSAPTYGNWRLESRTLLNPGSQGGAAYHVVLKPGVGETATWEAGDIAEIGPENADAEVRAFLAAHALDGAASVQVDGAEVTLASALRNRVLTRDGAAVPALQAPIRPAQLVDALPVLAHREYSIASIADDGLIDLLVRRMYRPDGQPGTASAWLCEHAPLGARIALRVRRNAAFHAPTDARPLILIGNGTGLAGLRGLLRARLRAGQRRNWLLFGERQRHCDYFWRDEIERWHADGSLAHVDLAFSRDAPERIYVQQRLREQAARLRAWVAEGASIHVCGSLEGMAPGVDTALRDVLGDAIVAAMTAAGRYRRDVY